MNTTSNNNLERSVSPDSAIKQPGVVHSPLFVQKKVELVSFDPEGDERGGLVPVRVAGYLGQGHCYSAASVWSQEGLRGHSHHLPTAMQNHLADRATAKQGPEAHNHRANSQASQREAEPPGVRSQVHLETPHPGESGGGGGGGGGRLGSPFLRSGPRVPESGVSEVAQVCPEEKLAAAEEPEEAEEARPVVPEQGDVSGGLHGGAEARGRLSVSDTAVTFRHEYPAALTRCTCSPANHAGRARRRLPAHRRILKDSELLLKVDEGDAFGVILQGPAKQPLQPHLPRRLNGSNCPKKYLTRKLS